MTALAKALHPKSQELVVAAVRSESPAVRTYRLEPASPGVRVAPFLAGQYISVDVDSESGTIAGRPYSLSGTPSEAERENAYRISVRVDEGTFVSGLIGRNWVVGTSVRTSGPQGYFTYEPLRDPPVLVCAAGGSGVAPFRSMIGDLLEHETVPVRIVLIQGARNAGELLFDEDFRRWEDSRSDRFRRIRVLSDPSADSPANGTNLRHGFIDARILSEAIAGDDAALFACGPEAMLSHLAREVASMKVPPRRVRNEIDGRPGAPSGRAALSLTVRVPGRPEETIPADPGETVLVALERAGLNPPARCRTGSCGWCRGRLVAGDVEYVSEPAGLRRGDADHGVFHPCIAVPGTDIIVEMPARPALHG